MSDKNIEKVFLYFVALSLLLHAVVLTGLYLLPEKKGGGEARTVYGGTYRCSRSARKIPAEDTNEAP